MKISLSDAWAARLECAMRKSDFIFKYRVRNCPAYNRALVRRGSITFWVDEQAIAGWCQEKVPGIRGRPPLYADTAIECALVVKAVFHLSLWATQGFLESVVHLMGIELLVPDYTTVCKRQHALGVKMLDRLGMEPRHVVIDTTGLKVFGAGEWLYGPIIETRCSGSLTMIKIQHATQPFTALNRSCREGDNVRRLR